MSKLNDLMLADEERIKEVYRGLFASHGVAAPSLGLRLESQPIRFGAVLATFGDRPPRSLLDLGCGFADLLPYLRAAGWRGTYIGLDQMQEFVTAAEVRHALDLDATFICGHLLSAELPKAEWCVALGICNHAREAGATAFTDDLVARAVSCAERTVLVDFLSTTSDRRRPDLHFTAPQEALALGLKYSRRVTVDHSYMPFEFLLKIRLDEAVSPGLALYESS